jgi:hypothetical protein
MRRHVCHHFSLASHVLLRRVLRSILVFAMVWAVLIAATGGFQFQIGGWLRVSSRELDNPLILASAAVIALIALARLDGPNGLAHEWGWWRRVPDAVAAWADAHRGYIAASGPAVLALVVTGLQVRRWLGAAPLWLDEEVLVLTARERSFAQLAGPIWSGSAPLGWLVAERAALLAFGTGEIVLRFIPMLFGAAMLLGAVWIGRRWLTPPAALVLVLLCAANRFLSLFWFEAKQYSADAFWGLVLPAMSVWAIEPDDDARRIRRAAAWWIAATLGQWFSSAAAIVTPGCALLLLAGSWRPRRRVTWVVPALGLIWVAGCLLHYELSLRYVLNSTYLYNYWGSRLPPPSVGLTGSLRWLLGQLAEVSNAPGGTNLWITLWILALGGFALGSNRALGFAFATVPLAAFALAGLRIVPFFERFVLWMVPALAVGVALILDRAVRGVRKTPRGRNPLRVALAAAVAVLVVRLCADVVVSGETFRAVGTDSNHGLDDRAEVRWLMAKRQAGDVIMTTRLGWPAIWWYGGIPAGNGNLAQGTLPDGGVMLEVGAEDRFPACTANELRDAVKGYRRVLVYIGFPDYPRGFPETLLHRLEQLGMPVVHGRFAELGQAEVVDLGAGAPRANAPNQPNERSGDSGGYSGCIGVQRAGLP